MINRKIYEMQAGICRALANPLRIEIIELLNGGEQNFGELLKKLDVSKSNLSQHLSIMSANGLVNQRREGSSSFFSLSSPKVAQACGIMREVLQESLNEKLYLFIDEDVVIK